MVHLYKYDNHSRQWKFFDYGVKSKVNEYNAQGYIVIFK